MFKENELKKINKQINLQKKIILITHYNPDGDAIGSILSFQKYLNKKGCMSEIIVPNNFPKFLKFLPDSKKILIAEFQIKNAYKKIMSADIIFCLDFNNLSRINILKNILIKSTAKKILIDHHENPDNYFFDYIYNQTSSPATSQIIYEIILYNKDLNLIDKEIATCIYTGIYTDTGGFRFKLTSSRTHQIISKLLDYNISSDKIISNILDQNSINKLKLLAKMLNQIKVLQNYQTAILYLSKNDMKNYKFTKGDTDGFVNYGLSLLGINFSIFLIEDVKNNFIKISFRSKNNFDVNKFAKKYFKGGGHKQAAGGISTDSIENTIYKIQNILQNEIKKKSI